MAKRNIQQIFTSRDDETGKIAKGKSSFTTLEKAIEDAERLIRKEESWRIVTMLEVTIINKETNEVLWTYKAA